MNASYDLVVIGAGPGGLSAALTGSELGLRTLLLDEQARVGGQIYRNVDAVTPTAAQLLGADYLHGRTLAQRLANAQLDARCGALAWNIDRDLTVTVLHEGRTLQVRASQVIAAAGAMERASPLPGWTLPGVMNAGAAQVALKSSGAVPSGRVVLAGAGPLLLLVAVQLLDAGANVAGLVETAPARNRWDALPHLPAALGAPSYLAKGMRMIRRLRRARVAWYREATSLRVDGTERAEAWPLAETCR